MRKIENENENDDATDSWIVCNHSTAIDGFPANTGKCLRIYLTVILMGQTYIAKKKPGEKITRDDLTCKITYCSVGKDYSLTL